MPELNCTKCNAIIPVLPKTAKFQCHNCGEWYEVYEYEGIKRWRRSTPLDETMPSFPQANNISTPLAANEQAPYHVYQPGQPVGFTPPPQASPYSSYASQPQKSYLSSQMDSHWVDCYWFVPGWKRVVFTSKDKPGR